MAKNERLLTETELELMTILWRRGEGSVNDVLAALPAGRDLAYTSVSTILRILEQKGAVRTRKEGRGHVYTPALKKSDYETEAVRHVVDKVFDGTPLELVKALIDRGGLSAQEIEEMRELLRGGKT
ncbi:MAG: BlaI/MecI/CopY family transcriptional regulator [Bdellovibrionaceae bacterium]|nr:BlaI/MecI/CopY family transcriptional regulator [Pseudobdellovibrionaceae bacterium]